MSSLFHSRIARLSAGIRSKKISPVEVVDAALERIAECEGRLNSFAHLNPDAARLQALSAEAAVQRGEVLGPLHGIPLSIKGNIDVSGWVCAAGSTLRKDYVSAQDAPLVARLRAAGAILLGNTNTPEFLMAWESNNLLTGKTSNPWDLTRTAGGSSGGEAAAIASGCSAGGIGSDGGGSIRVPAHFSGICGLKPTPGRVPSTGHFPPGAGLLSWLGVVGPLARTVADVRALFEVIAGPDPGDAHSIPIPVKAAEKSDKKKLKGMRVGLLESDALPKATKETEAGIALAAKFLEEAGIVVEPVEISRLDRALDNWWFFFGPVVAHLFGPTIAGHESQLSPIFREYMEFAAPKKPLTVDELLDARARRDLIRGDILHQLREFPILVSPVSAKPAFKHGEGTYQPGAAECYCETMRHSQWLNLVGLPGASVPVGTSPEGLPIGVQVIGQPFEEELVLTVSEVIEEGRGPWQPPPI